MEASQMCDIASHPDSPQLLKISSMFLRENNETDDSGTVVGKKCPPRCIDRWYSPVALQIQA